MRVAALAAAVTRPPQPLLMALSAGAWLALATAPQALLATEIVCGGAHGSASLALALLRARPPAGAWVLMLLAMMLPLLTRPLTHIWVRSLARRRWWSIALFLFAYAAIWTAAGAVLLPLAIALRASVGTLSAAALALVAAAAWRATPAWQMCQNRCHGLARLDAFGLAADRDCIAYGASAAIWCVGTCWALMLLALVAPAHLVVMACATAVAFVERQAQPRPVRSAVRTAPGAARSTRRFATPTPSP